MVGDALLEFLDKIRYTVVGSGKNRSLWPDHEIWAKMRDVYRNELFRFRSGVIPSDVKTANRQEFKELMDMQALGIIISRAVADGVDADGFYRFLRSYAERLKVISERHLVPLEDRMKRAKSRRVFT